MIPSQIRIRCRPPKSSSSPIFSNNSLIKDSNIVDFKSLPPDNTEKMNPKNRRFHIKYPPTSQPNSLSNPSISPPVSSLISSSISSSISPSDSGFPVSPRRIKISLPIQGKNKLPDSVSSENSSCQTKEEWSNKCQISTEPNSCNQLEPHFCYLLRSLNPKYSRRTYVGYTINLNRRLRQHNGEIVGGAKKTSKARPWKMVGYVSGFPNSSKALSFEWHVHHSKSKNYTQDGRIQVILSLMNSEKFRSYNLKYHEISSSKRNRIE